MVRNFGLATFVASVGFIAGPKFFRDFRKNAKNYILLGFLIILSGALCCVLTVKIGGIRPELAVGLLTGALTSTPGLAAAQEAAGEMSALATTGYAIAYPFGVVGVVLFVQLIPKMLKIDVDVERKKFAQRQFRRDRALSGASSSSIDRRRVSSPLRWRLRWAFCWAMCAFRCRAARNSRWEPPAAR